ncbi:MAG: transposase [Flavobacteriales bacterium]|jgi:transposase
MGLHSNIIIKESLEDLNSLYKREKNSRIKLRLKSFIYTKENKFSTQLKLSIHLGVDHSTLKKWLKQYRQEGLSSCLSFKSGGNRASVISKSIHEALEERLNSSEDCFKGYWDVQDWIRIRFNQEIKYNTIRTYLIRHFKTKLKTPRKSHYKKDEQAIEAFFKTP